MSVDQVRNDAEPFRIQRLSVNGLTRPTVPVSRVALIAFLAVEVSMYPRTLDSFVLLCGFVRSRPIVLRVPPQSGECGRESGWRLGRGEGLTGGPEEIVAEVGMDRLQINLKPSANAHRSPNLGNMEPRVSGWLVVLHSVLKDRIEEL